MVLEMKENPYLLSDRLASVSSIEEATGEFGQLFAESFQDDTKHYPALDEDKIEDFPVPVMEKIDEQEPEETSEEEEEDDDGGLANVWLN